MLTIRSIKLENFMPYDGKTEINLGTEKQPIVIVHGNNMAGKTSLFSAIRWALYGEALDRFGTPMQTHLLLNKTASRRREFRFSVELDIAVTDETDPSAPPISYLVQRHAQGTKKAGDSNLDFDVSLSLYHDQLGTQSGEQATIQVESLLPRDISRFFFFDGEMLNEYEELVRDGGDHAKATVRQAIESILGYPSLTLTTADIQHVRDKIQSEISKEAKQQQSLDKYREQFEDVNTILASREKDEAEHQDAIRKLEAKVAEANAALQESDAEMSDVHELLASESHLEDLDQRVKDLRSKRQEYASDLWRDILHGTLRDRITALDEEIDKSAISGRARLEVETRLQLLEQSLEHATCEYCKQSLPRETIQSWEKDRERLKKDLAGLPEPDDARIEDIRTARAVFGNLSPANVSVLIDDVEKGLHQCAIDRHRTESKIKDLKHRLAGRDPGRIATISQQRDAHNQEIGALKSELGKIQADIARRRSERAELSKKLKDSSNPRLEALQQESAIAEALSAVMENSESYFVDKLRSEVQARSSEIFLRLTSDPTYTGLQISEEYGLTILDRTSDAVPVRSAGAEQVVAFSLIGALNDLAMKRGPLIMDTVFGRLDSIHRKHILEFLPELCEQVVLLVHDREIDTKLDLGPIRDQIAREYVIERTGDDNSVIREIGATVV